MEEPCCHLDWLPVTPPTVAGTAAACHASTRSSGRPRPLTPCSSGCGSTASVALRLAGSPRGLPVTVTTRGSCGSRLPRGRVPRARIRKGTSDRKGQARQRPPQSQQGHCCCLLKTVTASKPGTWTPLEKVTVHQAVSEGLH